jgi:hypothetical protein
MKNYHYDYITLKARHEGMKLMHDAKIDKLNREIAELRAKRQGIKNERIKSI